LTAITYTQGPTALGNLTYSYDAAGHRTAIGGTLATTGLPQPVTSASYNAANQLVQWNGTIFTYDANGNLVNDGSLTYAWNARNQLTSQTGPNLSAAFQYDAFGRRQAKAINASQTNFLYDGSNSIQEQSPDGSVIANVLTGLGIDQNYVRNDAAGSHTFLADAANSAIALVDASGNVAARYSYDPFGNANTIGSKNLLKIDLRQ